MVHCASSGKAIIHINGRESACETDLGRLAPSASVLRVHSVSWLRSLIKIRKRIGRTAGDQPTAGLKSLLVSECVHVLYVDCLFANVICSFACYTMHRCLRILQVLCTMPHLHSLMFGQCPMFSLNFFICVETHFTTNCFLLVLSTAEL